MKNIDLSTTDVGKGYQAMLHCLSCYKHDALFLVENFDSVFKTGNFLNDYIGNRDDWLLDIHLRFLNSYGDFVLASGNFEVVQMWLNMEISVIDGLFGLDGNQGENWRSRLFKEVLNFQRKFTFFDTYDSNFFEDLNLVKDSEPDYFNLISDFERIFSDFEKSENKSKIIHFSSALKLKLAKDVITYYAIKGDSENEN